MFNTIMFRTTLLALSTVLIGCAGPTVTRLPGGLVGYEVTCSGSTWEGCEQKANALCPDQGYRVLKTYQDYSRRAVPRSMLITCNVPPSGQLPKDRSEASKQLSSRQNCCAELDKSARQCNGKLEGAEFVTLSDPLEIALVNAVRASLPRSELESLVRMLSQRSGAALDWAKVPQSS